MKLKRDSILQQTKTGYDIFKEQFNEYVKNRINSLSNTVLQRQFNYEKKKKFK